MDVEKKFSQYSIKKLKGDGSTRIFYRLINKNLKYILMINNNKISNEKYLSAYEKYTELGVPVAKIIDHSIQDNFILFEDLGDIHLRDFIKKDLLLLKKSIDIIFKLQFHNNLKVSYHESFDNKTFEFESDYAFLNYCSNYKNKPYLKEKYKNYFETINTTLSQASQYLSHRDYHPDNIMVRAGKIYLIDYQDTRLGPMTYDLVSLLYDRSNLSFEQTNELKKYFLKCIENYNNITKEDFEYIFTLNTIQRMFKILGSFAYLSKAKNNPHYLEFIPQTLLFLHQAIKNSPFHHELKHFAEDLA